MPASPARLDGGLRLLAQRVDHADQPDEHEVAGEVLLAVALRQVLVRQGEDAQRPPGQLLVVRQHLLPVLGRHRPDAVAGEHPDAGIGQRRPGAPLT